MGFNDLIVYLKWLLYFLTKRKLSTSHLIKQYTQRPNIRLKTIPLSSNYLWRHIMWCSYYGKRSKICSLLKLSSSTKVYYFQVSVRFHYRILWLYISIYNLIFMQKLCHNNKTSKKESYKI